MSTALEQIELRDDAASAGSILAYAIHDGSVNVVGRVNRSIEDGKVLLIGTGGQIVCEIEADHKGLFCGFFSKSHMSKDWPFKAYHFDPANNVASPVGHEFWALAMGGVVME